MHVSELFDPVTLQEYIDEGLVTATRNADDDLTIYNYTPKAQYSAHWDDVTVNCRGLILDDEGVIIARPFPKFFNFSETDRYSESITPDTEVMAFDKLDGSLGIIYRDKKGQAKVATRGSFTSVQAVHASEKLQELNIPHFENITMLVEIIYPENQIVLDYKGKDDLFLLGGIHIPSGEFLSPVDILTEIRGVFPDGGFRYLAHDYSEIRTVQDALDNLNRENREGFVLHTNQGTMVKVKQDDYLAMHRAVFHTSKRSVWYAFAYDMLEKTGKPFDKVATRRIRAFLTTIEDTGGSAKLLASLEPLLPENLLISAESTLEEYRNTVKSTLESHIEYMEGVDTEGVERRDVFLRANERFGSSFAGIITDILLSESDEQRSSGFDRLALSVVESVMPKKGERLTEELTEEEE